MKLEQIDHIAITAKDVNASVKWYWEVLGMERKYKEAWGDNPAMVCAGSTCIALFPEDETHKLSDTEINRTHRHFAFRTDRKGFERAQNELKERRIEFEFEDHEITHSIYFKDLNGYNLEITTHEVK